MSASAILLAALVAQADRTSRNSNQPVEPFRVIGNIHYVGANDVTSFLIASPAGHILLDGGFVETAPQILVNIRRLGFRPEDVKVILNSHAHFDHAGGFAELKRVTGASLQVMEGDAEQVAGSSWRGAAKLSKRNSARSSPVNLERATVSDQSDRIV